MILELNVHTFAADIADRVPAMALDSKQNNAGLIERLLESQKSSCLWKTTEPPKGENIIAIGRVIITEDFYTSVEPFLDQIIWEKDQSGYEGWHYTRTGMTVARALDDEIKIDWWIETPKP